MALIGYLRKKISNQQVRVTGLQGKDCAYIWLFNTQATWASLVIDKITSTEIKETELEIKGLQPGAYQVQ